MGGVFGPFVVEVVDETAERDAAVVEALLDTCCVCGVVGGDPIVMGVEGFDEIGVELFVEQRDFRAGFW